MKERPILFSAPMVRALLDGSKTQTRRAVKPQPPANTLQVSTWHHPDSEDGRGHRFYAWADEPGDLHINADWCYPCPYGQPGDRLWVRETHAKIIGQSGGWIETDYFATYKHGDRLGDSLGIKKKWTPSIHMPRAASRIDLEVTGVRAERLQDISEADAIAEGIERLESPHPGIPLYRDYAPGHDSTVSAVHSYTTLWEQINGPGSWGGQPWVWVVEFRRIRP